MLFKKSDIAVLFSVNKILSNPKGGIAFHPTIYEKTSTFTPNELNVPSIPKMLHHIDTEKSHGQESIPAIVLRKFLLELCNSCRGRFFSEEATKLLLNSIALKKSYKNLWSTFSLLTITSKLVESIIYSTHLKYVQKHILVQIRITNFTKRYTD